MSERQALAPGLRGAHGLRSSWTGANTALSPFRRCSFELGNTEIYIRPCTTLAESSQGPEEVQKKQQHKKTKQTRGALASESLPMGKMKHRAFRQVSQYRWHLEKRLVKHTTSIERSEGSGVHMTTLY